MEWPLSKSQKIELFQRSKANVLGRWVGCRSDVGDAGSGGGV